MAEDLSDSDFYYCDDCKHWLSKEQRKGASNNRCKKYVLMTNNIVRFNQMNVCKTFKFGDYYD